MSNQQSKNPVHIANYVLLLARQSGIKDMSFQKLVKIVYISYAWHLYVSGEEMFSERPIALWFGGPMFPSIYRGFEAIKIPSDQPIEGYLEISEEGMMFPFILVHDEDIWWSVWKVFDTDVLLSVMTVFNALKDKTSEQLSKVTYRKGGAFMVTWDTKRQDSEINDKELIKIDAQAGMETFLDNLRKLLLKAP